MLGSGAVPTKKALPPRAACRAAVSRGEYASQAECLAAWQAGVAIPPVAPAAPPPPPPITSSPVVKYAGIALAAAIVLGGGFLLFKKDRGSMVPNGLTRRQRGARKGARTRAAAEHSHGTRLWDVLSRSTNRVVGTIVAPNWKTHEDVKADAEAEYGDVYVASKRKQNKRRRR